MAILVTGGTGNVGRQVLDHLRDSGAEVRALTRKPDDAQLPAGVTPVKGDLSDIDGLREAMKDVSSLFLLVPNVADELTQALQTLDVAREAGVKGIVYLSVFKSEEYTDVPHFTSKFAVEKMIEQFHLPVTVLRPSYFIQNEVRLKDALLKQGVYGTPIGAKGISMVDVRDIGDAAARELLRRERASEPLHPETYDLVGPDAMNGDRVTTIWSEVLQRPIRYGGDDLAAMETRLRSVSPPWLAYDLRLMMQRYQQDGAVGTTAQLERFSSLLGRPPRSYLDFARSMANAWARD